MYTKDWSLLAQMMLPQNKARPHPITAAATTLHQAVGGIEVTPNLLLLEEAAIITTVKEAVRNEMIADEEDLPPLHTRVMTTTVEIERTVTMIVTIVSEVAQTKRDDVSSFFFYIHVS